MHTVGNLTVQGTTFIYFLYNNLISAFRYS